MAGGVLGGLPVVRVVAARSLAALGDADGPQQANAALGGSTAEAGSGGRDGMMYPVGEQGEVELGEAGHWQAQLVVVRRELEACHPSP